MCNVVTQNMMQPNARSIVARGLSRHDRIFRHLLKGGNGMPVHQGNDVTVPKIRVVVGNAAALRTV